MVTWRTRIACELIELSAGNKGLSPLPVSSALDEAGAPVDAEAMAWVPAMAKKGKTRGLSLRGQN